MPSENQTEKSRYPSKYSPGKFVTAAQYIAEFICEKKAVINKQPLKERFWTDPTWAKFYKQQILAANGLLKIYTQEAILAALKTRQAYRIFSLRAPHLDAIIEAEQRKIDLIKEQKKDSETVDRTVVSQIRENTTEKSLSTKLREI